MNLWGMVENPLQAIENMSRIRRWVFITFCGPQAHADRIASCWPIFNWPWGAGAQIQRGRLKIGRQDTILPHTL